MLQSCEAQLESKDGNFPYLIKGVGECANASRRKSPYKHIVYCTARNACLLLQQFNIHSNSKCQRLYNNHFNFLVLYKVEAYLQSYYILMFVTIHLKVKVSIIGFEPSLNIKHCGFYKESFSKTVSVHFIWVPIFPPCKMSRS